jgi:hypothetical protein
MGYNAGVENANYSHGMHSTPEYESWRGMKSRCNNPNRKDYEHYGERGITYDPRWEDFENFYADMGDKPGPEYSLDRYPDNDGNYCKDNCRWATQTEQKGNRRNCVYVTVEGRRVHLREACDIVGLNYQTVRSRINRGGWSIEEALELEGRYV